MEVISFSANVSINAVALVKWTSKPMTFSSFDFSIFNLRSFNFPTNRAAEVRWVVSFEAFSDSSAFSDAGAPRPASDPEDEGGAAEVAAAQVSKYVDLALGVFETDIEYSFCFKT